MKPVLIAAVLFLASCTPKEPAHPQTPAVRTPVPPSIEAEPPRRSSVGTTPTNALPHDTADGLNQMQQSVDEMWDRNNAHLKKLEKSRKDMLK